MMGNTVKRTIDYLKDPYVVRGIQETFGARQVAVPSAEPKAELSSSDESSSANGGPITNGRLMNGTLEWLSAVKVRRKLKRSPSATPRASLSPSPSNNNGTPLETDVVIIESIPLVDIYFRLATELGYEPFYITFLPFMFWNVDSLVTRHVVILWCVSMYLGQACKAIVKLKRPSSPPVFRLEDNPKLETEFGFPSTHAIVAATIPFCYLHSCFGRYEFPLWLGLPIALTWCFSVCLSRIYLGVHTILDVLAGLFISFFILVLMIPGLSLIDDFLFHCSYAPFIVLALTIFILYIYPVEPDRWTMDRGDTAAIWGVGVGVIMGFYYHGPYPDDLDPGPYIIVFPSLQTISMCVIRFIVGILLLVPVRFLMKLLCFKLLPAIMPTHGVEEVVKRPLVELPYKIITYSAIGFSAAYVGPVVFEICNIARWEEGVAWG